MIVVLSCANLVLILANIYIPPTSSKYAPSSMPTCSTNMTDTTAFANILQLLFEDMLRLQCAYNDRAPVMCAMGDFNAHTGSLQGILQNDTTWLLNSKLSTFSKRFSCDTRHDARGRQLLAAVRDNGFCILNGRCWGDPLGACTYQARGASSVLDYVLI